MPTPIVIWANSFTDCSSFNERDGGSIVEADNIPPSARTIEVPRQTDRQNHSYYIVAFVDAEESGVSDIAMDMYSYVVHAVGSFTLEVVK